LYFEISRRSGCDAGAVFLLVNHRDAALEAAEDETADPDPDDQSEEVLAPEYLVERGGLESL